MIFAVFSSENGSSHAKCSFSATIWSWAGRRNKKQAFHMVAKWFLGCTRPFSNSKVDQSSYLIIHPPLFSRERLTRGGVDN